MVRPSMHPLLQVRDLAVCYRLQEGQHVPALQGVTFDVAAGESIGLLGESGCGKSTLGLSLLAMLPSNGRVMRGAVTFRGTDLLTLRGPELQRLRGEQISVVHQEPAMALNPVLRVGEQVAEVLRAHPMQGRGRIREEVMGLLRLVGLPGQDHIEEAYPHQLSGGQQQRIVIAQAIACHPALLIADEPTTALDDATRSEILALLKGLQVKLGLAIVLISHDPDELAETVGRVLVMYAGRIVEEGPTSEVFEGPLHPYTRALLRCRLPSVSSRQHKQPLASIREGPADFARLPGCAFAVRCPDVQELCRDHSPDEFSPEASRRVTCFQYAH